MSFKQALTDSLKENPLVTSHIGRGLKARIYTPFRPSDKKPPSIQFKQVGGNAEELIHGGIAAIDIEIELVVSHTTRRGCDMLSGEVIKTLSDAGFSYTSMLEDYDIDTQEYYSSMTWSYWEC